MVGRSSMAGRSHGLLADAVENWMDETLGNSPQSKIECAARREEKSSISASLHLRILTSLDCVPVQASIHP